jgi:hypothetical protein
MAATTTDRTPATGPEATLRQVIEELAPLERRAGSPGEEQAAHWLAKRLTEAGAVNSTVEEEPFLDGYAPLLAGLGAVSAIAGVAALKQRTRRPAAIAAALATAAIADDVSNGPRAARRITTRPKTTWNVIAESGDPAATKTLVVLAHHDAAPTGMIFDDRLQAWFGHRFPGIIERKDTSLPFWWAMLSGPALVALGAARNKRGLTRAGLVSSIVGAAVNADIARSPVVPGANDNLTAVAVLVALAELLRENPPKGLRVLLVSCGAEEVIQGGIHAFGRRHFPNLDREHTWFLNLDTVGSPKLILLEGEGSVVMEDYFDRSFRDLIARAADNIGAPVRRGMRARTSTDAVIPSRAGFPTATLASMDRYKALSNYHRPTDTPENVDYTTVHQAVLVAEAVARELAANPWVGRY